MSSFVYQRLKKAIADGDFDWTSADLKLLLLDAAGGFVADPTDDSLDVIDGELDVAGYARVALTSRTTDRNDGDLSAAWLLDDVTFPALGVDLAGVSVAGAIVFVEVVDDSDSWPALYLEDVAGLLNGTDFVVTFDPAGLLTFRDG